MGGTIPGAGAAPKITKLFKAKLFSFSDVVVDNNSLTLYQISEPLQSNSSASGSSPAPYGLDLNGKPFNDPLPDTLVGPATGQVVQSAGNGTSALMDRFTVTKPDLGQAVAVTVNAAATTVAGAEVSYQITVQNNSSVNLNGVQADLTLPAGAYYDGQLDNFLTLQSPNDLILTMGRLVKGESRTVTITARAPDGAAPGTVLSANLIIRSATAMPFTIPATLTSVIAQ